MKKNAIILSLLIATSAMAQQGTGTLSGGSASSSEIRGMVAPQSEALLSSPMVGRLKGFFLSPGQKFVMGQTIMSFDCEEQEAKSAMAKAELDSAVDTHQAKMKMQGLAQASELEVKMAAASVSRAQANDNLYGVYIKNCSVVAPFSGRISKISVKPYQGVQLGQPLVELISDKNLKVKVNAPAKLMYSLKVNDSLTITIDETGKSHKAIISAINSKIDPVSQTFEVEAKIDNTGELVAGMSGSVKFK